MISESILLEIALMDSISAIFPENKFLRITDLNNSAVSRFSDDPEFFKSELKKIDSRSTKFLKHVLINSSTERLKSRTMYYINLLVEIYLDRLIAILQVDLERPGFIDNFPEALEYKQKLDCRNEMAIPEKIIDRFNNLIERFDRYSEKFDNKYLIDNFNIDVKNLDETRIDDYVSFNFLKLFRESKKEQKEFLKTNFSINKELIPVDYKKLVSILLDEKEFSKLRYKDDSLKWLDYYFDNQEELLKNLNPKEVTPEIMKMINFTLV